MGRSVVSSAGRGPTPPRGGGGVYRRLQVPESAGGGASLFFPCYGVLCDTRSDCCSPSAPTSLPPAEATAGTPRPLGGGVVPASGGALSHIGSFPWSGVVFRRSGVIFAAGPRQVGGRPFFTHSGLREVLRSVVPLSRLSSRFRWRSAPEARAVPAQPILVSDGCRDTSILPINGGPRAELR
ncbi:hypothetical protein NDU88_000960 [Pleurodeles waltl]|uniref:Uncharacterized protein n=1 Tax=Pleurodeles waltl TaxID=8319 RepID=A0AAV7V754_PLEWA|nr:hypothetical protein NDU88_000960 [Pleurodeles waltl]